MLSETIGAEQIFEQSEVAAACPICGCGERRLRLRGQGYEILECTACGIARTLPAFYVSTSHYADAPALADGYRSQERIIRRYARRIVQQVRRTGIGKGRWLDVGCSVGFLTDEARRSGFDARGVNLDRNAIRIGQSLGYPVSVCDMRDLPDSNVDVLSLSHSLEHIPQPAEFVRLCREKLAPSGVIYIAVPCHDSFIARVRPSRWYGWQPAQHYFHYSRRGLAQLLSDAGFQQIRLWQESMDHWPRSLLSPRSLISGMMNLSLAVAGTMCNRGDQLVAIAGR